MARCLELRTEEIIAEYKDGPSPYRLRWPDDRYYGLMSGLTQIEYLSDIELAALARVDSPTFPKKERLSVQLRWFVAAAKGQRTDWPALPVLTRKGGIIQYIDGRHRCEALAVLNVVRIPVIIGQP